MNLVEIFTFLVFVSTFSTFFAFFAFLTFVSILDYVSGQKKCLKMLKISQQTLGKVKSSPQIHYCLHLTSLPVPVIVPLGEFIRIPEEAGSKQETGKNPDSINQAANQDILFSADMSSR